MNISNDNNADQHDDPTKDMSAIAAAIFNCLRFSDPLKQIEELEKLHRKVEGND